MRPRPGENGSARAKNMLHFGYPRLLAETAVSPRFGEPGAGGSRFPGEPCGDRHLARPARANDARPLSAESDAVTVFLEGAAPEAIPIAPFLAEERSGSCVILVTDLTAMRARRVCLAGVDLRTLADVRPTRGAAGLTRDHLRVPGGDITIGCVIEFLLDGARLPIRRPHTDDVRFDPSTARVLRRLGPGDMHRVLSGIARPLLSDIYGARMPVRCVEAGDADRSLGTLLCRSVRAHLDRIRKLRVDLVSAGGERLTDVPFNDLLLRDGLALASQEGRAEGFIADLNRALNEGGSPIARVGLTRPFDPYGMDRQLCWLQVNAVYPGPAG